MDLHFLKLCRVHRNCLDTKLQLGLRFSIFITMGFDVCSPLTVEVALPRGHLSYLPVKMQRNFNTVISLERGYPSKRAAYGEVFKCLCLQHRGQVM